MLVGVGGAAGGLAVATLWFRGLSEVNLDSLLEHPALFYALLVVPALVAVACLVAAFAPRIVAINLAVLLALLGVTEGVAWLLSPAPPEIHGELEAIGATSFYVPDPAFGYVLASSIAARHRRTEQGRVVYDVTYRTDERGRRQTPASGDAERRSFLLFFGDSNTFGEGLGQTETLPYHAGQLAPNYRPYNYGVPGYGPTQLLTLTAASGRLRQDVAERDGHAVFFLIPAHVARVVGSTRVSTGWGRHFPYYTFDARGALAAHGDFSRGRPFTTLAYFFWTKSSLAEYLGVDLPLRYTARDYRLVARILAESGTALARELQVRRFVVVLGQVFNPPQLRVIHGVRDALAAEGVAYLDYTGLFDPKEARYRLSKFDYHNSADANRAIAARLVSDLHVGR